MSWTGSCNQCGRCCTKLVREGTKTVPARCEHLRIVSSELTECRVWETREAGMPVRLVDAHGEFVADSSCDMPEYPVGLPADFPLPTPCSYRWEP